MAKYDFFKPDSDQYGQLAGLVPFDEYRVIQPSELEDVLPKPLLDKYNSVVAMNVNLPQSGVSLLVFNGYRVEQGKGEVDQMPFAFAWNGCTESTSGVLRQHGDWSGRTQEPPSEFFEYVNQSGTTVNYPLAGLPPNTSGKIAELESSDTNLGAVRSIKNGLSGLYPDIQFL